MATESVELLFKFATQGQSQLDAVAASVDRVTGSATNSGNAVDRLTRFMTDGNRAAGASGRSFAELGDKIRSGFQNPVGTAMGALDGLLTKLGGGAVIAGGFGLALAIAGQQAIAFVKSEGEAAEQTINFADRLGIAIGRAEQLQAEMRMAGVNAGALEGAVRGLSLALEDPAGAGEKTIAALRGLGVATNEVSGAQRELGPVLLDVITKLGSITSDSERVAAAQRTLGRGAAIELLPWIKNHPNHGLHTEEERPVCPNCGSKHVVLKGTETTKTMKYQRYRCVSCGTPIRGRFNLLTRGKSRAILTQSKL